MSDWEDDHHDHPDIDDMTGWDNDQLEVMMNDASEDLKEAIQIYNSILVPKELQSRIDKVLERFKQSDKN